MLHVLSADHLIVDPPRSGLSEELMDAILVNSFQKIFYLSCDVKTLARDLKRLLSSYEIKRVIPIKMFYHTSSLETLIVLIKI
ncbi:MAG: hypothetical protein IH571_01950 [Acholeplasmataceae bacterium]|nr:hypothetical protein [Acholeplasmataceae bacterium]